MIVTTDVEPDEHTIAKAKRLAADLDGVYAPRGTNTLSKIMQHYHDSQLIKVTAKEIRWVQKGSPDFFFHPSMSAIRVLRLARGERDSLLQATEILPGDQIVDCTMGMASDAIVMSYAAGSQGRVTALESSRLIYTLVSEGLRVYDEAEPDVTEAMRRIQCLNIHHLDYLRSLPDQSVDVVYFDPMFRQPEMESAALNPLRSMANPDSISSESVEEAVRVARKRIVMKEKPSSGEFQRLGFDQVIRTGNKTAYGVIRKDESS
ncbi:class I SAM-dependent methyltransferase [Marinicrinis lubricantis]|uniref:Class I SAM-dependent methyltransferase n=1 Tax=Marinicrinis lubricantis TaxID=2086470 RepID=A0ABW1ITF8_9BACL